MKRSILSIAAWPSLALFLLMAVSGQLPVLHERIECQGWIFELVALEGGGIERVLAHPAAPVPASEKAAEHLS